MVLDLDRDVKRRSLLDIPETRADWWAFFSAHLAPRLEAGACRLALFGGNDGSSG